MHKIIERRLPYIEKWNTILVRRIHRWKCCRKIWELVELLMYFSLKLLLRLVYKLLTNFCRRVLRRSYFINHGTVSFLISWKVDEQPTLISSTHVLVFNLETEFTTRNSGRRKKHRRIVIDGTGPRQTASGDKKPEFNFPSKSPISCCLLWVLLYSKRWPFSKPY